MELLSILVVDDVPANIKVLGESLKSEYKIRLATDGMKALKIADTQGAVAAGWPDNELIGDRIIIPPATDVETAGKRPDEYECFDWWFCHKPLEK